MESKAPNALSGIESYQTGDRLSNKGKSITSPEDFDVIGQKLSFQDDSLLLKPHVVAESVTLECEQT